MNWQTFGHEAVKNILDKQLVAEKFPHAYLLNGPEGVGKKTLALEFAKQILKTKSLNNHPDFLMLDSEAEISVEQLLEFTSKLSFKPFVSKYKVAIINNAQNLNKTSANALLKTLEEPGPSTIIILVANTALLKTITSRCQVLNFSFFPKVGLENFAQNQKLKISNEMLALSFGSSARLLKLAQDQNFYNEQKETVEFFKALKKSSISQKFLQITELSDKEVTDLKKDLTAWAMFQFSELQNHPEEYKLVDVVLEAALALDKNLNKKLVLQGLIMKL